MLSTPTTVYIEHLVDFTLTTIQVYIYRLLGRGLNPTIYQRSIAKISSSGRMCRGTSAAEHIVLIHRSSGARYFAPTDTCCCFQPLTALQGVGGAVD